MAAYTELQTAIATCKATLGQLNIQLSAFSTAALTPGSTADVGATGPQVSSIESMTKDIVAMQRVLDRLLGNLNS